MAMVCAHAGSPLLARPLWLAAAACGPLHKHTSGRLRCNIQAYQETRVTSLIAWCILASLCAAVHRTARVSAQHVGRLRPLINIW